MPLIAPRKGFRTIWMFPRNIRYIEPWKLSCILSALTSLKNPDMGSRETQDALYAFLAELGVKQKSQARDKNDGGMRTYYAQMEILGLTYSRQLNLTIAGKKILEGKKPLHVLQTQLLRLQYPSAYGNGSNVKMHPELKVKPFIFIITLLNHPEIKHLSTIELMIPVIYGHTHECLEICIAKILKLRQQNIQTINQMAEYISADDLYLPKKGKHGWSWGDNPTEAQIIKRLENIKDIANTAGNYLKAAQFVHEVDAGDGRICYEFNKDCTALYQSELHSKFLNASVSEESFQRSFGRYDKIKDTSKFEAEKKSGKLSFIQTLYLNQKKNSLFKTIDIKTFAKTQSKQWGISEDTIINALDSFLPTVNNLEHDLYLDYSNSGTKHAIDFEKATEALLKALGFDQTVHIGQKKAPSSRRGGYPDICIKCSSSAECGLADMKATNSFIIAAEDELKLKQYYLNSNTDFFPESTLAYYLYIAGNFKKTMPQHVERISKELNIPVTAMRAKALLSLYEKRKDSSLEDVLAKFTSGTVIENC